MSIDQLDSKISELTGKREEISVSANTEEGQQAISALDSEIESLQSQKIMLSIGAQLEGGATVDQSVVVPNASATCCILSPVKSKAYVPSSPIFTKSSPSFEATSSIKSHAPLDVKFPSSSKVI